ncbi:hypothetical protein P280DRAFT_551970 [Massarina eburnea CBS 473.64]|uniref:Beta-glucuronidase C-terminal domain-containing protein n=1 Tax=Massarina eburnea CBS 473.64 TaxID=1395130 RepID=A0A6A6RV30_9PLEO|nr:hypothetical protein P280DRAFT_551970 [Massarina eburnea CBS 473.64]
MLSTSETLLALTFFAAQQIEALATVTSTLKIALPTARPQDAYEVPANFPSVGFEHAFLPGFNDDFSSNLIEDLAGRMDDKPIIRVGGTSGDIIKYNPDQTEPHVCLQDGHSITGPDIFNNCSHQSTFILGPHFFDAFTQRYKSARISIQAPLDPIHSDNLPNKTNVVSFIKQAYKSVGADRIDAIAIGNEVNFYEKDGLSYVKDGLEAAKYIKQEVQEVSNSSAATPIWELLNTAWEVSHGSFPWAYSLPNILTAWRKQDSRVKYVAEHYYQFDGKTPGITAHLLNHTDLVAAFKHYQDKINWTRNVAKASYILSEAGGPLGPRDEATGHFAIALWGANFMMYAMSHGVDRISLVQRPGVIRALWTPFATAKRPGPMVQAQYYSYPFIADFLGRNVAGKRGVVEIPLNNSVFSAYGMFEGGTLTRVAVVNLREYSGEGDRKAVKASLEGLGDGVRKVVVGRLHADEGTAAGGFDVNEKNITWSGEQWSVAVNNGRAHGKIVQTEVNITNGVVDVVVPDSEAVIVYLK